MAASKEEKISSNNLVIIMILVTLLVVGISALAVKFLIADIGLNNKVVTAKNAAEKTLTEDVDNAPKLIDDYSKLGDNKTILSDALPNTADFPSLIITLENMTNRAGVTLLQSVSTTPGTNGDTATVSADSSGSSSSPDSTEQPTPVPYKFTINFNTSYNSFLQMLKFLELSARPMKFTGLTINGGGTSQSMNGELDVETYYQDKASLPFGSKEVK